MKHAAILLALGALTIAVPAAAQRADSAPNARTAMHGYGACVADASPERAAETLAMDFKSSAYSRRLQLLSETNRGCFGRRRGAMRSGQLMFAGAIAERLIERGSVPLKTQLAHAAARPAAISYSPTDQGAICVVRSAPDDVAALFATDPGTDAEATAAAPLAQLLSRCMSAQPVDPNIGGLRAILATAAFRSIHAGTSPETRN